MSFLFAFISFVYLFSDSVAYFESEEFRSAKSSFEFGLKIRQQEGKRDTAPITRYIRKCEAELAGIDIPILSSTFSFIHFSFLL
jgi:hypothetical protein